MARMDKITRILLMYSQISQGGRIYKRSFCMEAGIDRRTFDRDIEDIRLYLSESFDGNNLIYDREDESYHLENFYKYQPLSAMEVVYIFELLNSCRVLREDEYAGLAASLLNSVEISRRRYVNKIMEKYIQDYSTKNQAALLKMNWDLQQCIIEQDKIELHFQDSRKNVVSPVGIQVYEDQMYLFAFDTLESLLTIPIAKIASFKMKNQKYGHQLLEKFHQIPWIELKKMIEKARSANEED